MSLAAASVRTRLVVMMATTALAALLVAGVLVAVFETRRARDALAEEMESLALLVGSRSAAALAFSDPSTALENLQALGGRQSVSGACLFDAQGAVVAQWPRGFGCAPLAPVGQPFSATDGLDVSVQRPVRIEPTAPPIGAVVVHSASAPALARLRDQAASGALAAVAALALSMLLALGLQRLISRPLSRMREVVTEIDQRRDLHLRLPDLGDNEFGALASSFNGMLQTIERQNADLAAREHRSRTLFHGSSVAQLVFDDRLVCVDANDAALRLLGVPARTGLVGASLRRVLRRFGGGGARLGGVLRQARADMQSGRHRLEWRLHRPDGVAWEAQVDVLPVGVDGRAFRHCTLRDVGEQRAAEAARDAQRAAESANRAKSTFLSRMSHEMRTPLNAVLGFLQLLERDLPAGIDGAHRRHIRIARQSGWHLLKLIDDALDLVRIESGRLDVSLTALDTREALDGAVAVCEAQAAQAGVLVHGMHASRVLPALLADELRLRQVLINLLSNAIKYNRRGGRVWVDAESVGGSIVISVTDNGLGIPEDQREHLFEPFHRLGRERGSAIEGTGLGLSLSRDMARLMGGDIVVQPGVEGGTRVVVTLRAAEAEAAPAAARGNPRGLPADEAPSRAERMERLIGDVLYVEDNPVNLLLVEQCLTAAPGIRLLKAETGAEGLRLLAGQCPQLVLLDMSLPDMTGLQWLAMAAEAHGGLPVTVIALSASAMPQEVSAARAAGVSDYWTKPIDLQRFVDDIATVITRSAQRSAADPG